MQTFSGDWAKKHIDWLSKFQCCLSKQQKHKTMCNNCVYKLTFYILSKNQALKTVHWSKECITAGGP